MKKNLLFVVSMLLFISSIFAQREVKEVTVHLNDGTTVEGLMTPNTMYPWEDQKSISIFDESLRNEKKIKKKQKTKYKAKDIAAYEYDGRYFESKKVSVAGRGDNEGKFSAIPRMALIEKLEEGKINVYMAYAYPPKVVSGITLEEVYEDLRSHPEYFLMKESDGKVKTMHSANIEKWIKDSDVTSQNYADGAYGNFKKKKGKKLGNFLKGQMDNEKPSMIIQIISDYNKEMAEK